MTDVIRDVLEAHTPSLIDPERCKCGVATPHWESFENHQAEMVREALLSAESVERVAAVLTEVKRVPRAGRFEATTARAVIRALIGEDA